MYSIKAKFCFYEDHKEYSFLLKGFLEVVLALETMVI